jgi:hypothetical protein
MRECLPTAITTTTTTTTNNNNNNNNKKNNNNNKIMTFNTEEIDLDLYSGDVWF